MLTALPLGQVRPPRPAEGRRQPNSGGPPAPGVDGQAAWGPALFRGRRWGRDVGIVERERGRAGGGDGAAGAGEDRVEG